MAVAADRNASRQPAAPSPEPGLRAHALADHVLRELDAAIAHLAWRGSRVHAGVHLARKALRRTRATIALGAAGLGPGAELLDRELRRVNRGLSPLRDVQALVETLDRLIDSGYDAATTQLLQRVRRVAHARRSKVAHEILASDPALAARRAMLDVLRDAMQALPWQALMPEQIEAAREYSRQRLRAARLRAIKRARDEDWHRWRRRARRVAQQRSALIAIGMDPDQLDQADEFDKRTTERLGLAQDLALLIARCGRDSPFSKVDRTALRAFAKPKLARLRRKLASR
ncbi:MAG TPA: CHAD domain-containing protein [Lysobacter sp.]|nr:CHAD domain-containing protein [Lysobacter sp.]